jgi:uncharacterized protein with LGFP repeats
MNENQSEDKEVSSLKDITRSNLGVTVTWNSKYDDTDTEENDEDNIQEYKSNLIEIEHQDKASLVAFKFIKKIYERNMIINDFINYL